jgi:hypothetical protein
LLGMLLPFQIALLVACASRAPLEVFVPGATRATYLPLIGYSAVAAPPSTGHAVRLPLLATLNGAPVLPLRVLVPPPTPVAPALPTATVPAAIPTALPDRANCRVYPQVRITWYELGSCCDKAPGHPEYGITRSGLPVAWGMAAVQAQIPLLPMGTRFYVNDIGPQYQFVVADTGSEMAFGSNWIDLYAPTIPLGLWLEQQVADGRSDVVVCNAAAR